MAVQGECDECGEHRLISEERGICGVCIKNNPKWGTCKNCKKDRYVYTSKELCKSCVKQYAKAKKKASKRVLHTVEQRQKRQSPEQPREWWQMPCERCGALGIPITIKEEVADKQGWEERLEDYLILNDTGMCGKCQARLNEEEMRIEDREWSNK